MDWQHIAEHLKGVGAAEVEVHEDYVSVPVGYREAIEIEEGHITTTRSEVYVTFRRWDVTNGLAEEIHLATVYQVSPNVIAAVVKAVVEEHEAQQRSIAQDEDEHFGLDEQEDWQQRCPTCNGMGKVGPGLKCPRCNGVGWVERTTS